MKLTEAEKLRVRVLSTPYWTGPNSMTAGTWKVTARYDVRTEADEFILCVRLRHVTTFAVIHVTARRLVAHFDPVRREPLPRPRRRRDHVLKRR